MELNIITRQIGDKAREVHPMILEDFWKLYLRLLYTIGSHVNQREEEVLAYVLARPLGIDHFTKPYNNKMREALGLARSEVTRLKQSLQRKHFIGNDNLPVPALANLQKYILHDNKITFVFPLQVITQ